MGQQSNDRPGRLRPLAQLCRDERGNLTIFGVIGFGMLMVVIGLVIDVGRVMNMHSQASSYADRVALAAAAELDTRSNALDRAIAAATGEGVARPQVDPGFRLTLSGDDQVDVAQLFFMSELGPDPADPFTSSPVAGDIVTATWTPGGGKALGTAASFAEADRISRYVLVETTRESEDYLFFPLLGALSQDMETSATVAPQALAGFSRELCNAPPVMMCSINEIDGPGATFAPQRGQMIRARFESGGNWDPGDLGVMPSPIGSNSSALRRSFGSTNPGSYCTGDQISVLGSQPSSSTQMRRGLNTRLDMYEGPMSSGKNSSSYAPAPNVVKGLRTQGSSCSNPQSDTSTPLPRDNCFMPSMPWPHLALTGSSGSGCDKYGGIDRAGDGDWDRRNYWKINHPSDPWPPNFLNMSRYEVYRYEIENSPPGLVSTPQEKGRPTCSSAARILDPARDRRVIPVAVVNCVQHRGLLNSPNPRNIPVEAYAEVFLTEPAGNTDWWGASNNDIFVEMIGRIRPDLPETTLREYPELYR